ncbi:NnrS family protein [Polaromonas naphthalenivorans]|uniref:NnrS family protein n=1 Tax=Polaromonas naphthalenivorans (strain CJ2) TaxID=365044 RepID=A1VUD7_POLNA|nr:NnrS family protein [Polaromonas naphthalenivorans]ABM39265.1 NnrS family protein [Polaromonas naphthalenivorans CJ2]
MSQPIQIKNPSVVPAAPPPGFALWELGFRPFYLLASVFAALSIGLWALQFAGWLGQPYLAGPMWHAHEMLFGFTLAVVVGFLFTAGRNWSGRPTPTGVPLMALAALWVAGRVLVLTPFGWAAAVANVAFPLAAAVGLAIPFIAARNQRNYFFIGLLLLMAAAVLGVHLAQLGAVQLPGWIGIQVALDVVLFIMAVMGGRVIPMFTNSIPGVKAIKRAWLEKAALGSSLALLLADVLPLHGLPLALLAGFCAAAHLARWALWQPWKTRRTPLVWVLHVAYFWIPVHLALRGLAEMGWVAPSIAIHALTVGAIGGLVIGMMTRTALGHTGRPLKAGRADVACYLLVLAAALVRVLVPLLAPAQLVNAVIGSAALWSGGFALYAVGYWPVLTRVRADGKPG